MVFLLYFFKHYEIRGLLCIIQGHGFMFLAFAIASYMFEFERRFSVFSLFSIETLEFLYFFSP